MEYDIELAQEVKVDDDVRKKLQSDSDCTMVTLLQPSEMLRSEIILHEAARKNSIDRVRKLINEKVDVNSRNNLDRTAVQWAAANGHKEVLQMLLKAGADIEIADKYGMRALLWAAWFGHKEIVEILITNGANVNCENRQGLNILLCAAQNNNVDILQFVQDSLESFPLNGVEKNGKSALHIAAEKGNLEAVEKLLDMNCDLNQKDTEGQTPVHAAAGNAHEEVLKKLLLHGIEVNDRDMEGRTALHVAAENGHAKAADLLMSCNADPNAETTKEFTPLSLAAMNGNAAVVATLIENGCSLNSQNHQGNTSLHLAALNNRPEIVQLLVDADCELNLSNKRMLTPLHAAVENGFSDVVEVLLIAGADLDATEKTGKTALGLASRGSFIGIVDMIIKADRHTEEMKDEAVMSNSTMVTQNSIQFKRPAHDSAELMKDILWKLAHKQLKTNDWKKLAKYWRFTDGHIKAIEHQYTGPQSHKEHGYRLLMIWLHGIKKDENPMKHLFEALVAIDRKELAEQIRKRCNLQVEKSHNPRFCIMS